MYCINPLKLGATVIIAVAVALITVDSHAALNLSVSPLSGGNNLRFGRVSSSGEVNKEVRIRITATDGDQYQVYHRIVDSFLNEKSTSLGTNAFSTYTLPGSNSSGTLYAQNPERMGFTDQLLYTSGSGGTSDAFTAVYTVDGSRMGASGNFFGRIQYIARPIGGASQDNVILNVTIEASGQFKIEINGSSSMDSVRLNLQSDRNKEGYVEFAFSDNFGQGIQIYQEVEPFLQDELFNEIDDGTVLFIASGNATGDLLPQALTGLTRKRVLIYSSQENEDAFRLNFVLNQEAMERQKAGIYKGQLQYVVEENNSQRAYNIQLEVSVEPVFAIEVDLPPQGLSFERLLPDSQPIIRVIEVKVKTNLGRPYMVMQSVTSPMTNKEGTSLPDQYFTFKGELLDQQAGKLIGTDYKQVPQGETSLYTSDNKGSPGRFNVSYRLRPFSTMIPGDYSTAIRYSLGEI